MLLCSRWVLISYACSTFQFECIVQQEVSAHTLKLTNVNYIYSYCYCISVPCWCYMRASTTMLRITSFARRPQRLFWPPSSLRLTWEPRPHHTPPTTGRGNMLDLRSDKDEHCSPLSRPITCCCGESTSPCALRTHQHRRHREDTVHAHARVGQSACSCIFFAQCRAQAPPWTWRVAVAHPSCRSSTHRAPLPARRNGADCSAPRRRAFHKGCERAKLRCHPWGKVAAVQAAMHLLLHVIAIACLVVLVLLDALLLPLNLFVGEWDVLHHSDHRVLLDIQVPNRRRHDCAVGLFWPFFY